MFVTYIFVLLMILCIFMVNYVLTVYLGKEEIEEKTLHYD